MFEKITKQLSEYKSKFSYIHVVLPVVALLVIRLIIASILVGQPTTVAYSSFTARVRGGTVKSAEIDAQRVTGVFDDGTRFTTVRVEDPNLLNLLEEYDVVVTGRPTSSFSGLLFPFLLMFAFSFWMMRRMRGGTGAAGGGLFSFGKSKARMTRGEQSGVTFADIGGAGEAITDLREVTEFLKNPEHFQRLGGQMPKGVQLVGEPGTGKTLLARATAGEAGVPFFSLSGAEFVEMFVGVGASRVRDLFAQAKKSAPAIIFIDEIDAIGGRRGASVGFSTNDEREQTLNQLLAEMDGFLPTTGLILVAATNRPDVLDPALLRPGRFDRRVVVGLPDLSGRLEILDIHIKAITLATDVDHESLARITPGFSGADMASAINEAVLLASREDKDAVTMSDFDEAIERVVAGSERRTRAMNEREKHVVAAHEAGHALVAALLPGVDPVHKVTIIPRGNALGYTWQRPIEDRYIMGQQELHSRLAVLLGGSAAEKLVFPEISTGAADDLGRATDLARRMVTEYGMCEILGPVRLAPDLQTQYLGGPSRLDSSVSPRTAARVDDETTRIVKRSLQEAIDLLTEHRESLDALAQQLCDTETVSGEQVRVPLLQEEQTGADHETS